MEFLFVISVCFCSLCGFLLAFYIHKKKQTKKKLICPLRSNCETVIHSDYSKILGIPVEVLGMTYYAFIGSIYGVLTLSHLWSFHVAQILVGLSACAVLFSLYLVSVQAFIIRQWCTWCLLSAGLSFLIFLLSYWHMASI